jgi:hypothetical protein
MSQQIFENLSRNLNAANSSAAFSNSNAEVGKVAEIKS